MLTTGYNDMHHEREEYEEKERKLADERLQEGLKRVRASTTRAARMAGATSDLGFAGKTDVAI